MFVGFISKKEKRIDIETRLKSNLFHLMISPIFFSFIFLFFTFSFSLLAQSSSGLCSIENPRILKGFQAKPIDISIPKIKVESLDYGASLHQFQDDTLPLVSLKLFFPFRYLNEKLDKAGLFHATISLLEKGGSQKKLGKEFIKAMNKLGSEIHFSITEDYWSVEISSSRSNFRPSLSLLEELLDKPSFDKLYLKDVKNEMFLAIQRQNEKPENISRRFLKELLFPNTRRGYSLEKKDAQRIRLEEIKKEFFRIRQPSGMHIAISGDIANIEIKKELQILLKKWQKTSTSTAIEEKRENIESLKKRNQKYRGKILLVTKPFSQASIRVGAYLPAHNHKDFYALQVANYILGGGSFTSRLTRKIRVERGLAYYAYSYNIFGAQDGIFMAGCGTRENKVSSAYALMNDQILNMKKGVSKLELSTAKSSIINSLVFQFDSAQKIVNENVRFFLHDMPENYLQNFPKKIQKIQTKDIIRISRYLQRENLYTVIVGDESLKKSLEKIKPVIVKKATQKLF